MYNIDMEQNYDKRMWSTTCPRVDCRRRSKKCCGLKYIFIPSVLGDDSKGSDVAPMNGAFYNSIVEYEANGATYLYSMEGIPLKIALDEYYAGYGISLDGHIFSADTSVLATKPDLDSKQDILTAGSNIDITDNTISAVDTTYTAGSGLNLNGTTFSVDINSIQPKLTAGTNITIDSDTISAVDTTYTAGNGLNLTGTAFSADTTVLATQTDLSNEASARSDADTALSNRVTAIEGKIPTAASSSNQLADKNFVNSSIGTNTSNYISNNGEPFTSVAQLEAYSGTVTNNDYAFVTGTDSAGNTYYDRYKATVSGSTVTWAKEYRLNNSTFTSDQWAALNSGINSSGVTKLSGLAEIKTIGSNLTLDSNGQLSATDTTYSVMTGAGSSTAGASGLVPAPAAGDNTKFLSGDGTWKTASSYSLPIASANELGGIKVGTNLSINGSGVLSATDTTYSAFTGTDGTAAGTSGLVPAPSTTDANKYLKSDGTWATVQAGPTVVQTTGSSTTDVMSQNSTTVELNKKVELTVSTVDIGEGVALAENTLYGVYE